jgi:hypothetical protein
VRSQDGGKFAANLSNRDSQTFEALLVIVLGNERRHEKGETETKQRENGRREKCRP